MNHGPAEGVQLTAGPYRLAVYGACAPSDGAKAPSGGSLAVTFAKPEAGAAGAGHRKSCARLRARTLLERAASKIPGLGIFMALCASFFLGTAGMLVKMTQSVHGIQVAVFRWVRARTNFGPATHSHAHTRQPLTNQVPLLPQGRHPVAHIRAHNWL